ncbi:O-6 methyl-guanine alkyl transferase [Trypanosoma conorhini]|uniref:Methylated-DNA--protein-cysteine methyltransferase n=1 Tax=Trypanosoma conorhini TaxID=83891 RepID=A0A3R7MNI2_9TRYP|nr:O-6 methyl-guanine alkyl transferase [Trypanosoma conorhini]RNF08761.1 O-6 methyl-guanine alkyl transferase [Trypanosoma conorhini]
MVAQRPRPSGVPAPVEVIPPLRVWRYTTPTPTGGVVLLVDAGGAVRLCNWTDCENDAVLRLRRAYQPRELVIVDAAETAQKEEDGDEVTGDARAHAVRQLRRYFSCSPPPKSEAAAAAASVSICQQTLHALLGGVTVQCPPSTPFMQAAWAALREVRPGETTTYGALARRCRRPNASRAVGRAMRENHVCLFLPCHRVVGVSRALTGFGAGLWRKAWLLRHEQAAIPARLLQRVESVQTTSLKRKREGDSE